MSFISVLITVGIAFWFYRTAENLGSKAMHWGAAGAIAYLVPAWTWKILVSKPYVSSIQGLAAKTSFSANLISHSWVAIGLVTAFLVFKFFLLKTNVKAD